MANAADSLADLLEQWDVPPNLSGEQRRSQVADDLGTGEDLWSVQSRAYGYLLDVERALKGMQAAGDRVQHFQQALPAWRQAVAAYPTDWRHAPNDGRTRAVIDRRDVGLLRALGGQMDSLKMVPLDAGDLTGLRGTLTDAESLLREVDVADGTRRYLLALVREALDTLDAVERDGATHLRSVTFELGGAMIAAGDTAVPDKTQGMRLRQLGERVLVELVTNSFVALGAAVVAKLTDGSSGV